MIRILRERTAPCARTLTCLALALLTSFAAGCAAATGGARRVRTALSATPTPTPAQHRPHSHEHPTRGHRGHRHHNRAAPTSRQRVPCNDTERERAVPARELASGVLADILSWTNATSEISGCLATRSGRGACTRAHHRHSESRSCSCSRGRSRLTPDLGRVERELWGARAVPHAHRGVDPRLGAARTAAAPRSRVGRDECGRLGRRSGCTRTTAARRNAWGHGGPIGRYGWVRGARARHDGCERAAQCTSRSRSWVERSPLPPCSLPNGKATKS